MVAGSGHVAQVLGQLLAAPQREVSDNIDNAVGPHEQSRMTLAVPVLMTGSLGSSKSSRQRMSLIRPCVVLISWPVGSLMVQASPLRKFL